VALIGTREILPMGGATFRSGRVILRIGDPISTGGMTSHDRRALTARLREQIVELLESERDVTPSAPLC
jgi:hypothetical protein